MAEPKKPKKPKPEGESKPRKGGKGGGWFRWGLWLLALVLLYALSIVPVRWLIARQVVPEAAVPTMYRVYMPVIWLYENAAPVRRIYDWIFRRIGA